MSVIGKVVIAAVAVLLFLFVWPGVCRYEYHAYSYAPGTTINGYGAGLLRVDRLTGAIKGVAVDE